MGSCPQDCHRPCPSCDLCPACGQDNAVCACPPEAYGPAPRCPACGGVHCACTKEEVDEYMRGIAGLPLEGEPVDDARWWPDEDEPEYPD